MRPRPFLLLIAGIALVLMAANPASAGNGYKIGVQHGTTSDTYAAENLPNADVHGYDDIASAVEALKQGDIEFVLGDLPTLKFYEFENEDLTVVDTFRHEEFGIGVAPGESDLLAAIDVAIGEIIDSGEYADIFAATFGDEIIALTDDTTGDTATEYPAEPSGTLADVLAAEELVFGADMYYPPFESYDDDGNCVGFDCDMAVAIAARIAAHYGQNLTGTMKEKTWDDLLAFEYNDYDASLTAMTKTAQRAEHADFSRSYYTAAQGVLASSDSPTITGMDDLNWINEPPTALINSITPSPAEVGTTVTFNGSGSDSDGTIVAYLWESSIDGELSTNEDFSSSDLSLGHHIITFQVQDNDGEWSTISDVKAETYEQSNSSLTGWRLQDSDNPDNYHESADYYESGRPTLLEFFHTDCPHCNNQVPTMKDIHNDYIGRIDLLAIGGFRLGSSEDSLADLRDFKSDHQAYWPHLYDSSGELISDYGFSSYPSFALVVDGQVVWSHSGEISYDGLAAVLDDYYIDSGSWNAYSLWIYAVPVAIAGADVSTTPTVPVQFNGQGTDEDGTIAKYEWDFDGNGVYDWSSTENGRELNIYNNEGTFTAVLRVTDNDGLTATDSRIITVSKAGGGGGGDDGGGGIPAPSLAASVAAVAVIALRRPRKP